MTAIKEHDADAASDIAIVGMACRFPGANSPDAFWTLLRDGIEARTELSDDALREAGVPEALIENPRYVKSGMFLQGMEQFDPGFFGFSPLDGKILDPQHRHFLECSWEALEDGGYDPARFPGAIGVFAGSGHNAYFASNLLSNPELVADVGFFLLRHTGNDKDFLATRASYCFDLKGPSVNVQTACSTSLVAVHQAAQSLLNGECDMALAGGVTVELPHRQGYLYKDSEILSRDGHCRPFDADASGTVFGSGVGVVLLKRLADARADGDVIHAVIKASAVNNDGAGKISYLAPSVDGQAAAIEEALAIGDIDPASVTYVECHGTGTPLGDPIEVAALNQAYGGAGRPADSCGIGSVKSNIGHLDTAAGVASLIKVVQSLKHRQLPATLHYSAPNPALELAGSPFYVNAALRDWDSPG
ncbi:MAG TPA: polyketide synthase, partial [Spongiibacteraceae bacterium]|nr:polyketide synthase [Spongiibacteraceae bacterium]